ncbi:ubiquitin-related domain-containing protein [Phycomyces nitens]|nr:ubiquitin-related domain-containing protein [Phycomyces nitens]
MELATTSEPKDPQKKIHLLVRDNCGCDIIVGVKESTQMFKLKKRYSKHKGIDMSTRRFLFDGERIKDTDTPHKLGMRLGDVVHVLLEQTGGCGLVQEFL